MIRPPPFPTVDLPVVLKEEYGLSVLRLSRIEQGHTNASYDLTPDGERRFVLRQSWRGKPWAQILREESLLSFLAREQPGVPAPRIVPTASGRPRAVVETDCGPVFCHLFEKLPGCVPYRWHDSSALLASEGHQRSLAAALARLHAALASFTVDSA